MPAVDTIVLSLLTVPHVHNRHGLTCTDIMLYNV